MKRNAIVIGLGAALVSVAAWGHWGGAYGGYGMGPGMMGGGYGAYGHGMMGGLGGYGRGMMGGYFGGGPGYCWGDGSSDSAGFAGLGLSDEQRGKIAAIQQETWDKQARLMDQMHDLRWNGTSDADARKAYDEMSKLRQQMFDSSLEARKRIEAVLTDEQKRKLGAG